MPAATSLSHLEKEQCNVKKDKTFAPKAASATLQKGEASTGRGPISRVCLGHTQVGLRVLSHRCQQPRHRVGRGDTDGELGESQEGRPWAKILLASGRRESGDCRLVPEEPLTRNHWPVPAESTCLLTLQADRTATDLDRMCWSAAQERLMGCFFWTVLISVRLACAKNCSAF